MPTKINNFPSPVELERISTLNKYRKLYDNEQLAVLGIHDIIKNQYKKLADMVYLGHGLPQRITEFYGDFVQGDVEDISIIAPSEAPADQEWIESVVYENDLKEKIGDYAEEQSEFGFVVFHGWVDKDGIYHIDSIPADQYFPQPDGSVVLATYKKDPADRDGKRLLLYTQHYSVKDDKVTVEREAFRCDEKGVAIEPYSLEAMSAIIGQPLLKDETLEGIDEIPLRQADNGRRSKWGFGKSDYCNIMPQLAEINERTTHASTQLLKNLDAKLIMPIEAFDEQGKLKYSEAYGVRDKESPKPEYVINANPLLNDLEIHVMRELKFIELFSCVPMWSLTRGTAVERVESLRIQLFNAVRKTSKKRDKIKRALMDMFRIGAKLTEQSEELQNKDVEMKFGDPLPVDELISVQSESEKIRSGISSHKSSMMRVEKYTDEEADAELEQIKSEDAIAGIGNANNAPTL